MSLEGPELIEDKDKAEAMARFSDDAHTQAVKYEKKSNNESYDDSLRSEYKAKQTYWENKATEREEKAATEYDFKSEMSGKSPEEISALAEQYFIESKRLETKFLELQKENADSQVIKETQRKWEQATNKRMMLDKLSREKSKS